MPYAQNTHLPEGETLDHTDKPYIQDKKNVIKVCDKISLPQEEYCQTRMDAKNHTTKSTKKQMQS